MQLCIMVAELVQKYNIQGPRYTSYPTVPNWNVDQFTVEDWKKNVQFQFQSSNQTNGIALYIHLPFCESLCTFCACHKHITKRHEQELPYIESVIKEWKLYVTMFQETNGGKPKLRELHLGGGTPTFFAPEHLQHLLTSIYADVDLTPDFEGSFEGHPESTTIAHLTTLHQLGFKRLSIGVQDYNETVQRAIHRFQSFEQVEKVHQWAVELGYESISQDLVYGLPFQTFEDLQFTLAKTLQLRPHRIAFYSYAHVPWIKGLGQRGFDEQDLPNPETKLKMLVHARETLLHAGYISIGMDHFALPEDSMALALSNGRLHRNFMGYTVTDTKLMIGLGMSSISDTWTAFGQNEKNLKVYQQMVEDGHLPIVKGHELTTDDLLRRGMILDLMCHFETTVFSKDFINPTQQDMFQGLLADGLIEMEGQKLIVREAGKNFVRNVAMTIDQYLNKQTQNQYSKTI